MNTFSSLLYTAAQVRAIDRAAIERQKVSGYALMQRAAAAAFVLLQTHWPTGHRIGILAGAGNNGGDAFLVGVLAIAAGYEVIAIALKVESSGDAALARQSYLDAGGKISLADDYSELPHADVWVDGLFGTGLNRAPEGLAARLIESVNAAGVPVLALDLPSGLIADTGMAPGAVIRAEATISFVAWKRGLFTGDAIDVCGQLELATLDISEEVYSGLKPSAVLLDIDELTHFLCPRKSNVHKGNFGHVLAIGGDYGMAGAIRLSAEAALRIGAGLVSVATRSEHVSAFNAARPEIMARGVEGPQALTPMLERATVVALGPGLGQSAWGHALWDTALRSCRRLVLDADALNLLMCHPQTLPNQTVLTPHPGEAARLLGTTTANVQQDRFAAVRQLAEHYQAVVVLKSAGTLIANPAGSIAICPWGNPGMASGGMGDVLTGVIAGLLAQGLNVWDAACLGVALHARAGDYAAGTAPRGLIASDLFGVLRQLVNGCNPA